MGEREDRGRREIEIEGRESVEDRRERGGREELEGERRGGMLGGDRVCVMMREEI